MRTVEIRPVSADLRPQVNVRVSLEQRAALLARAAAEDVTVTAVVERAIEQYLARDAGTQTEERRLADLGRRVRDLVARLAGDLMPHPDPVAARHAKRVARLLKKGSDR